MLKVYQDPAYKKIDLREPDEHTSLGKFVPWGTAGPGVRKPRPDER